MIQLQADTTLSCEGMACPLPVVRTKKAMEQLPTGAVLEVRSTDKGSVADLQSWADRTGHQYIGIKEENGVFRHFIRRADPSETKEPSLHQQTVVNSELEGRVSVGEKVSIIDVREPAEFAFGHVSGALSIPLGELESRLGELDPSETYYVICRTGNRSDVACRMMSERGFGNVVNVLPGMSRWQGEVARL